VTAASHIPTDAPLLSVRNLHKVFSTRGGDVRAVSDVSFELSRTDNLLVTNKLTGQARIVPLAYPKEIDISVGFFNPALQLRKV